MKNKLFKKRSFDFRGFSILLLLGIQMSFGIEQFGVFSQNTGVKAIKVSGIVRDDTGLPLPGASVILKGNKRGTITDANGRFYISVADANSTVIISFLGMTTREVKIGNKTTLDVKLEGGSVGLQEVVTVGYGVQKKINVVGAISSIKGEQLLQAGGVTTIGQALQGQIPGLTTMYTNGKPGSNDIKIFIRGQSSWNTGGNVLVMVDGVERDMNDIDMNEVDNISVLKDASATAVYGVRGANGVILITTKRGKTGKAKLTISGNLIAKTISKVPEKYESYDAMMIRNEAIMRELPYSEASWAEYVPIEVAEKYRNQTTQLQREMYPNVDWKDYMFKDVANDYQLNLSVSGGTEFAKYASSLSFVNESDMTKDFDTGKGYNAKLSYKRLNYRSNLDFNLTPATKFSVNLSGSYSRRTGAPAEDTRLYVSLYNLAPDLYYPRYSDGSYGFANSNDIGLSNSLYYYTTAGQETTDGFRLNTDFALEQKLDFILKGLAINGRFTMDNTMTATQVISDPDNIIQKRYQDGKEEFKYPVADNNYNYVIEPWTIGNYSVGGNKNQRIEYQFNLNYQNTLSKYHNVSALLLFKRQKVTIGSGPLAGFPTRYEDLVGRVTYNYNSKYFIEVNGAYNGSELYGPDYRRDLFPSLAIGWMISNESLLKQLEWLDKLKLRASAGEVGDDQFSKDQRWLYQSQWGTSAVRADIINPGYFGLGSSSNPGAQSPYNLYIEKVVGNKDIHWERALKKDIGFELSLLKGSFTADLDYFEENRRDIFLSGSQRSLPDWFGASTIPGANIGAVDTKGYELVFGLKHSFSKSFRMWADWNFTHAKDIIINKDDPFLKPSYLKSEGYSIDQTKASIPAGIMQNWDDIYMSTPLANGNASKRPGYYDVVDFNGDGIFNTTSDNAPYGYPNRPQNTWNVTLGAALKGFSLSAQLFAQSNTTRDYVLDSFSQQTNLYFKDNGDYWSKGNPQGVMTLYPWRVFNANTEPLRNLVDASMVRLKMVEFAYRFSPSTCKKIGIDGLRLFVNGNNLFVWTKMADDRDYGSGNRGTYPTLKRFNFGFNLEL